MKLLSLRSYAFAAVAAVGLAAQGEVKVVRVVPNAEAPENPDGASWETAYGDIKTAYESLGADGGEVWIKKGLHILSNAVEMAANIGVYGGFAGTETSRAAADPKANMTLITGDWELNDGFLTKSERAYRYNEYTSVWDYATLTYNEPIPEYKWWSGNNQTHIYYCWTPWPKKEGGNSIYNKQTAIDGALDTGCAFANPDGGVIGKAVFEGIVFSGFKTNVIATAGRALSETPYESELLIRNCRFLGCVNGLYSTAGGGAFCPVRVKNMPVTVDGCEFNRCLNGIFINGDDLKIENEVAFTVTNCTFSYVACADSSTVRISNVKPSTPVPPENALKTPRYHIVDCCFDHGYRMSGGTYGVVANANGLVERCTFRDARAYSAPISAINVYVTKDNTYCNDMEIRDCQFLNNTIDAAPRSGAACCIATSQYNKDTENPIVKTYASKAPVVRNCYFANNKIKVQFGSNSNKTGLVPADYGVCFQQDGLHANRPGGALMFINCTAVNNGFEYIGSEDEIVGHFAIFLGGCTYVNCVVKDSQFVNSGTGAGVPQYYDFYACRGSTKFVNTVVYNDNANENYHFSSTPGFCYNTLATGHGDDDLSGLKFSELKPNPAGVPMMGVTSAPDKRPGRPVWDIGNDIAIYDPAGNATSPWVLWSGSRKKSTDTTITTALPEGAADTEHLIPDANGKARRNKYGDGITGGEAYGPLCAMSGGLIIMFQ